MHNRYVVQTLQERGAIFVEETDEVPEGSVVVFSAHGVAPSVRTDAARRALRTIDATCPLVTKVHREAARLAKADYDILLVGQAGHDEIIGTTGHAPQHIHLVDGPGDVADIDIRDPLKVAWLSQTTLPVDQVTGVVARLRDRFTHLVDPPSDDICYAAQNRQAAVKLLADRSDLVLVVGSPNSHNTRSMVNVARQAGVAATYLVDGPQECAAEWLRGVVTVGLTGGASVPEIRINEVLRWLVAQGYGQVETVEATEEHQMFALPRELDANAGDRSA